MHEKLKGDASFWEPYVAILPEPSSVLDWSDEEIRELQDRWVPPTLLRPLLAERWPLCAPHTSALSVGIEHRRRVGRSAYKNVVLRLCERYPVRGDEGGGRRRPA